MKIVALILCITISFIACQNKRPAKTMEEKKTAKSSGSCSHKCKKNTKFHKQ